MTEAAHNGQAKHVRDGSFGQPAVAVPRSDGYALSRFLLVILAVNGLTGFLLIRAFAPGKPTIVFLAIAVATLVTLALSIGLRYPGAKSPWVVLGACLLASRQMLYLATGRVFGVRDSGTHVLGLPIDIIQTGHIPEGATYSTYPVIHIFLASAHFFTGLDVWNIAPLLATLITGATAIFVVLLARDFLPGSQMLAFVLFLGMMNAIPVGQLYQPMTVTLLLFAMLLYVLPRRPGFHLSIVLFLAAAIVLTMTHAYSASVLTLAIFTTCLVDALVSGRRAHLVPSSLALAYAFTYAALVGDDLDFLFTLFDYSAFNPATELAFGQPVPPSEAPPLNVPYRIVNNLAFTIPFLLAIVGWTWMLKERRFRPATLQWTAVILGALYFTGSLFPFLLASRTLALSAILVAAFAAFALVRLPRPMVLATVPLIILVALTSALAVNHYFPWSDRNLVVHPNENDPAAASILDVFADLAARPARADVISSHEVFFGTDVLRAEGFSTRYTADDPGADYFVFRTDSPESGYAKISYETRGSQARSSFTPFPTDGQIELLSQADRFAQVGDYQIYRA